MKISFFIVSLRDGGAERVMVNLANEFVKNDDVSIITIQKSNDHYELDKNVKRFYLDKRIFDKKQQFRNKIKKLSILRIVRLVKLINNQDPDVIITFLPLPSIYIMAAKSLSKMVRKTPVILSERADPNVEYHNKIIEILMKLLYKNADGFVFQTEEARKYYNGFIKCNTTIIGNPISNNFLNYKKVTDRKKTVVSCGRLVEQKNFKFLIKAFSKFSIYNPDYSLEIYGDGEQKNELLELIKDLGMKDKITLEGRVEDVARRIADAGMFVLASKSEGMPNALMEAMALGIPCISTDCPVGGPRVLIKNNYNGLLIEVSNQRQLIRSMSKIASDEKFAAMLSKNGINELKKYSIEKIVEKWRLFIIKLVKNDE